MSEPVKWKAWFKVRNDELWYTSSARFLTEDAAIEHAREKFSNWTQADSWIVVKVGFNPNEESVLVKRPINEQ